MSALDKSCYNKNMLESQFYDKLIDVEKDMENLKGKFIANFSDRLNLIESNIQCLNDKMNIFVPDCDHSEAVGVEAFFGRVNSKMMRHNRDINLIKAQLGIVTK